MDYEHAVIVRSCFFPVMIIMNWNSMLKTTLNNETANNEKVAVTVG